MDPVTWLASSRRAVMGTTGPSGSPRLFPIAYAALPAADPIVVYTAIDEKPKTLADPMRLARVRDITQRPRVSLLLDRWSEDWRELEWMRLDGSALVLDATLPAHAPERRRAIDLLRQRYPQYETHRLETRPIIRIVVDHVASWSAHR